MNYHWCDEHPEHPTGPGVTTRRAQRNLRIAVGDASHDFIGKVVALAESGIISKWDAKQLILGDPS